MTNSSAANGSELLPLLPLLRVMALEGVTGSFIVRQNEAPRYESAVWISIGSHILMVGFVLVFSAYFFIGNKMQKRGKKVVERTVRKTS